MLADQLQSEDSKILLEMLYRLRGKMSAIDQKLDVILLKDKNGAKTIEKIDENAKQLTQDLLTRSGLVKEK